MCKKSSVIAKGRYISDSFNESFIVRTSRVKFIQSEDEIEYSTDTYHIDDSPKSDLRAHYPPDEKGRRFYENTYLSDRKFRKAASQGNHKRISRTYAESAVHDIEAGYVLYQNTQKHNDYAYPKTMENREETKEVHDLDIRTYEKTVSECAEPDFFTKSEINEYQYYTYDIVP